MFDSCWLKKTPFIGGKTPFIGGKNEKRMIYEIKFHKLYKSVVMSTENKENNEWNHVTESIVTNIGELSQGYQWMYTKLAKYYRWKHNILTKSNQVSNGISITLTLFSYEYDLENWVILIPIFIITTFCRFN